MRASERSRSTKQPAGAIAGYVPPDLVYDQQMLARARQLDANDLRDMIRTKGMRDACLQTGFRPKALLPLPVTSFSKLRSGFQQIALSAEEAQRRWNEHEEQRVRWVAAVLSKRARNIAEATGGART